ncbi:autoinducer binding domain-containing protein [Shimia sp. R9_1]|uniref:helix-turn-helix transcriptional regulator n=1 Tax=Shimia sp. R9_1 TaxID=2821111 RepID=UPI001ADAFE14|nr:LuxR family transcriptional regulator [Shimia sp. R9_1]MBO9409642.1 autoinducer binding domain-containing protein [Shimia sp. R9_1]
MDRTILECAYSIETAKTPDVAWARMLDTLSRFKLDKVIYATRDDGSPPHWNVRSSLPNSWPRELAKDPEFIEPFVTFCCATFEPTKVGAEYLDLNDHYIDEYTREYIQTTTEFDWHAGIGIPTALKGSGRHGGFILGNAMMRYDFERSVMPLVDDLRTLCLVANARFETWRKGEIHQDVVRPLSPREIQTLEMLSRGLRPKQIADELGLKESSVRLYTKNARSKLGASNNNEAVRLFIDRQHK